MSWEAEMTLLQYNKTGRWFNIFPPSFLGLYVEHTPSASNVACWQLKCTGISESRSTNEINKTTLLHETKKTLITAKSSPPCKGQRPKSFWRKVLTKIVDDLVVVRYHVVRRARQHGRDSRNIPCPKRRRGTKK